MIFRETPLKGVFTVEIQPHRDERGQFVRTWCQDEFRRHSIDVAFVQSAVSINTRRGTLRGLHWQVAPHEEAKLVRCARGGIYDVVVDIAPQSPTFGQWFGISLTSGSQLMLFVPPGFAHGFQTLVDDTEVSYQLSGAHAPASARGLRYDDPALGIDWPVAVSCISERDRSWPLLQGEAGRSARPEPRSGLLPPADIETPVR